MANAIDGVGTINVSQLVTSLMSVEGGQQKLLTGPADHRAVPAQRAAGPQHPGRRDPHGRRVDHRQRPRPARLGEPTATSSSTTVAATASSAASTDGHSRSTSSPRAAAHRLLLGTAVVRDRPRRRRQPRGHARRRHQPTIDLSGASTLTDVVNSINGYDRRRDRVERHPGEPGLLPALAAAPSTGAAGAFTISGLEATLGSPTTVSQGSDAVLKIGPAGTDTVRSSTNTFADLLPGSRSPCPRPSGRHRLGRAGTPPWSPRCRRS